MLRYILLFGIFVFVKAITMDPEFESIVQQNAGNPREIVKLLQGIREHSEIANVFLNNFGGDDYQEEAGTKMGCSEGIQEQLQEAALLIGCALRKVGELQIDNESSLVNSSRFLTFANRGDHHDFVDGDISCSFSRNQLNEMISKRYDYRMAIEELLNSTRETDYSFQHISEELLEDM